MSENRNYIDLLPDEVLCMIFDHLKLKHVKNASLTCKRWYDIIYESGYIDRFELNISILNNQFLPRSRELDKHQLLLMAKRVVKRTERPYRRLHIGIETLIAGQFRSFWKIIHPKITQNLRVLNFSFINGSMADIFPLIIDAIPSMPQLKSLSASGYCDASPHQNSIPTIRSKSIEHLVMKEKYQFAVDMPQLQTFSGALNALESPATSSQPTVYGNLRHLKIHVKGWKSTDLSVFGQMPCLETIDWGVIFPDRLFTTLSEICPSLIEFRLPKSLYLLDMAILNPLSKVTQLRRLSLNNIVMYRLVNPVLDFSKLTHLEELDLGKTVIQPSHLRNLPKSIRKLALHLDPKIAMGFILMNLGNKYEQNLIDFITCNLMELTELRIRYHDTAPSEYFMHSLPLLGHLEVLEFSHCNFKQSFFLGMATPMHRLHTLRFIKCRFQTKHLLGLKEKFPYLKRRKVLKCFFANEPKYSSDSEFDILNELDESMEVELNSDANFNGLEYECEGDVYDDYDFVESALFLHSATMST